MIKGRPLFVYALDGKTPPMLVFLTPVAPSSLQHPSCSCLPATQCHFDNSRNIY